MTNPDEKKPIDWANILIIVLFSLAFLIFAGMLIATINGFKSIPVNETTAATTENTPETTTAIIPPVEETIHIESTEAVPEATEPPVTTETIPDIDPYEREMMAIVVYQEAGGDLYCDDCRRRVADIVLNRVADSRFPDSIEGVLTQYAQYGTLWKTGIQWLERADDIYERHAVERAYDIAEEVLKGRHSDVYGQGYIFQAEFVQGKDGFWCCGHWYGR